jgi:acetylglutamate kinase
MLNVNGDEAAGAVAGSLGEGVVFLTNVAGVLDDPSNPATLLPSLTRAQVEERIHDGRISGGMIPKVEAALTALALGAPFAVIADGRDENGVRLALAGGGTRLSAN